MKYVRRIFVWSLAVTLAVLGGGLSRRSEMVSDFAAIVTAGRLNVIAARDRHIVITFSDYPVDRPYRWRIEVDKTSPVTFAFDRAAAKSESWISFGGFR